MMNIFRRNHYNNKGFILVTALLVSAILLIIVIPYISRVAAEYRLVSKMHSSTIAINVAEAGIERAIWEICYNGSAFSGWTHVGTGLTDQTWTISNVLFKDSSDKAIGYYDGSVFLPQGSKTKTITVTAYVPNKTKYDGKKTVMVNYYSEGLFPLSNAIAANGLGLTGEPLNNSIKIDSDVGDIDSYDSLIGPYNDPNQVEHDKANIVTNGDIQMSAATDHVHGNAYYGGKFAGNKKAVTGIVDKLQAPLIISFPDQGLTGAKTNNNNLNIELVSIGTNSPGYSPLDINNNLSILNGAKIKLPEGTYYFKSISTMGNGNNAIEVEGHATIYVDGGKITTSGTTNINAAGSNPKPSSLIIYSNYSGSDNGVSLGDDCNFYGVLYAPSAIAEISEVDFYGAVVCKTINFKGETNLHYDVALGDATSSTANNRSASWQEQ